MIKRIIGATALGFTALGLFACGSNYSSPSNSATPSITKPPVIPQIAKQYNLHCFYPQAPVKYTTALSGCVDETGREIEVATFPNVNDRDAFLSVITKPIIFRGDLYVGILIHK